MLIVLKRDDGGLELSLAIPYERKFRDAVQVYSSKIFKVQLGSEVNEQSENAKKIEMEIGFFQITLVTFVLSICLHSALKLFRVASSLLLP